jgi:hypothetical protein
MTIRHSVVYCLAVKVIGTDGGSRAGFLNALLVDASRNEEADIESCGACWGTFAVTGKILFHERTKLKHDCGFVYKIIKSVSMSSSQAARTHARTHTYTKQKPRLSILPACFSHRVSSKPPDNRHVLGRRHVRTEAVHFRVDRKSRIALL